MNQKYFISGAVVAAFSLSLLAGRFYAINQHEALKKESSHSSEVQKSPIQNSSLRESPQQPEITYPLRRSETLILGKKETLGSLLMAKGISPEQVNGIIKSLSGVFSSRQLREGLSIEAHLEENQDKQISLKGIAFKPNGETRIVIDQDGPNTFKAQKFAIELKKVLKFTQGRINASFYGAAVKAKIPVSVVNQASTALSYTTNMQTGTKSGDPFALVYEVFEDPEGQVVKTGALKYVAIQSTGKKTAIYQFEDAKGHKGFYNASGECVERSLLQTPVDLKRVRISSKFGLRKHPIKGYTAQHKGIDFAAPHGTAVMAAGDGIVVKACYYGNYGKYVKIRHEGGYETVYAHLSAFGPGIRAGARVSQRQVIGRVGSTGSSTGPHLHHEVIYKNVHVNPQSIKQLPSRKLSGSEMVRFTAQMKQIEPHVRAFEGNLINTNFKN